MSSCPASDTGTYTSGTIGYTYDVDGNVLTKTAPAPNQTGTTTVVTNYSYDSLHRLTRKSYNDGSTATVQYGYDGTALTGCTTAPPALSPVDANPISYRSAMCDGSGATSWSHDAIGRVLKEQRKIGSTNKPVSYQYNLDGSLWKLTYPGTGKIITYTPGAAGRPLAAKDVGGGINYVVNAHYAPFGGLTSMTQGTTPITVSNSYNKRLQPVTLSASTPSATLFSLSYDFHVGTGDNGNVFQIVNNRDGTRTVNYTYDALNRLKQANTTSSTWGETYTLDPWGNLTNIGGVTGKTNHENLNAAPASVQNKLPGFGYDAAGNMISNGSVTYTFDAENRLTGTAGWTYTYDGDGKRVKKTNGSAGTVYFTGTGSDPIAENSLSGTNLEEYIFFNGKRIARRDVSGSVVHYYFSDHLGSTSVVADATGTTIEDESDYYPFGGERPITTGDPNNYKFTGKERDSESSLDMFGARYYANTMGRFMTPDWADKPIDVPYADFGNPQSLNLYSYVKNNPTTTRDPDGHCTDPLSCGAEFAGIGTLIEPGGGTVVGAVVGGIVGGAVLYFGGNAIINGLQHPDNSGDNASPPPSAPTNVPQGTPGTTETNVSQGTPASTSQQGVVDNSPAQMAGGPKAANAPGVTAGGQATDKYGNKLGPSRETQVNTTRSNTREAARNRALNEGSGAVEHSNPTEGNPHFHPTDNKGKKKPSSTHHEYPD